MHLQTWALWPAPFYVLEHQRSPSHPICKHSQEPWTTSSWVAAGS